NLGASGPLHVPFGGGVAGLCVLAGHGIADGRRTRVRRAGLQASGRSSRKAQKEPSHHQDGGRDGETAKRPPSTVRDFSFSRRIKAAQVRPNFQLVRGAGEQGVCPKKQASFLTFSRPLGRPSLPEAVLRSRVPKPSAGGTCVQMRE